MDHSDVVSAQVFLTDITQFKRMNAVFTFPFSKRRDRRALRSASRRLMSRSW
jgi:enamine deaminase RidA (YjgF/YER057c/UK114 family)